ncbi:baseplate J family protein [Lentzea aerocolonigenes]|uniref:Baseplate J family protein n=1 Tax=Lentzea aerocolonigenes TaxID=68170 RepID=A0A0F0H2Z7_LENAE|nr:putative baseplate assembly protein [Lentzea aerocolonigenes]KJK49251.1 baseplate J family protein [Lentzea aerocolonigenes]
MTLPVPNLDDRRFQDLVDDAKRLVMKHCPEWTDHNVSDPGVTLIETFAFMTDQLLYRLNRVPDRLYVKFLELIGVRLMPPTAASAPVTFWLSAPATAVVTVSAGTRVATGRTETIESILFTTTEPLAIVPSSVVSVKTCSNGATTFVERLDTMRRRLTFDAFTPVPKPGDALLVGLPEAVPCCAVQLDVDCHIDGVGVDPVNPPLAWEAWTGTSWEPCEVSRDDTGGLNRKGVVVLHVPPSHTTEIVGEQHAGWLRAVVTPSDPGQPRYSATPVIHGITACTVGGTVTARHAEPVENEVLGESEGVPGQSFTVRRTPVLTDLEDVVVEVSDDSGWQQWTVVESFGDSGPDDRHVTLDAASGVVTFGPVVREQDGGLRQYGAVPERGVLVRLRRYLTGGGVRGNVRAGAISTLKTSIPFVDAVENRRPALGGVDAESLEQAKLRGPMALQSRNRAVTARDYELICAHVAPELARIRCLPPDSPGGPVRVLLVPSASVDRGRIRIEDLLPSPSTTRRIAARLEETRVIGTSVVLGPPTYRGVTVVARLVALAGHDPDRVHESALAALYGLLNPLTGGQDGTGWPFGRAVHQGQVYAVLQSVPGVALVEDVQLFGANPVTGERGASTTKLELEPHSLVFSYEHQIWVETP